MFGAGEPRLAPLGVAEAARLAAVRADIDPVRLRKELEWLPAPRVRNALPELMADVDTRVLGALTAAGWSAELRPFVVRDIQAWADGFDPSVVERVPRLAGVNVVAVKEGTESTDAVVVLAHHDTVPGTGGADDNGSGVVGLLELARVLAPVRQRRTVILAAVDHEELGFWGSRQLVAELSAERRVLGAFVFEMLAYASAEEGSQQLPPRIGAIYPGQARRVASGGARGDFTAVIYTGPSRALATSVGELLAHLGGPGAAMLLRAPADLPVIGPLLARVVPFVRDFARSDHVPFWDAGLPAVQITDTANFRNPHYHRPGDTPDTLNYDRLADVVAATAIAVERLAGRVD
jgi:Zn-dependent M28 family amino/carboxypeptidase